MNITEHYQHHCNTPSDIHEHLPTLKKYASECDHVTEMGVRWICSTWGLLEARPKKLISYDIQNPSHWGADINVVCEAAKQENLDYKFIKADVLGIEIDQTDLLFIDTWHVYGQLLAELNLHCNKVNKYLIMHDTTSYAFTGESEGHSGLWPAISDFLDEHPEWILKERFSNNNGLTILERAYFEAETISK